MTDLFFLDPCKIVLGSCHWRD